MIIAGAAQDSMQGNGRIATGACSNLQGLRRGVCRRSAGQFQDELRKNSKILAGEVAGQPQD
eukprot:6380874-Alexandrium_andersonii.AAC.1